MSAQEDFRVYRHRLPHWRMTGSVYFVNWCLRDDARYLDPAERDIVASCIKHFHQERYKLFGYVVMDDHVHAVLQPINGHDLTKILHTWKSFTAHAIQKLRGSSGPLWQKDTYDRIVRDEAELLEKLQYILDNPLRRWPEITHYRWAEWFPLEG